MIRREWGVDEAQYRQLCANRRRSGPAPAGEVTPREERRAARGGRPARSPVAEVLARAAQALRAREAATEGWARVAEPAWLTGAVVESMRAGTVTVAVSSGALLYELRRQAHALERRLARVVPGAQRLVFVEAEPPRAGGE